MKDRIAIVRALVLSCGFCVSVALTLHTLPAQELALGEAVADVGDDVSVPLSLSSDASVEGLVAVFEWDGARGRGVDLAPAAAIADADVVEFRVGDDFVALGVVVDTDGDGLSELPTGDDTLIATATIRCLGAGNSPVSFVDGSHRLADESPLLNNLVVIGGLSVERPDLRLRDGSFSCRSPDGQLEVTLDVKPGSCPNPVNVRSQGVTPVAIIGSDAFDIDQLDVASILLEGVAPLRVSREDVSTPYSARRAGPDCRDCSAAEADGTVDLTLKFDTQELVAALGEVEDEECRMVQLTANLKAEFGGNLVVGDDVLRILKKGRENARRRGGRGNDEDDGDDGGDDEDDGNDDGDDGPDERTPIGDANGDGAVDMQDPLTILGVLVSAEPIDRIDIAAADRDQDGDLDLIDALVALRDVVVGPLGRAP